MTTPTILQKPSPNAYKGREGQSVIVAVIHIMDGFLTGTDSLFSRAAAQAASHYGVGQKPPAGSAPNYPYAEIHQYVQEEDAAWHAGLPANCTVPGPYFPKWPLYKAGSNPNLYSIGIENEGFGVPVTYGSQTFQPTQWTDCQYEANAYLVARAAKRWGFPVDRLHVIEHGELYAGKTGRCPGPNCDMDRIVQRAQEIFQEL